MRAFDGALLDRVDRAKRGHDFAGAEHADLKFAAGNGGHPLGDDFTAAVDRVQTLGKARRAAPAHFGHGLCDRRRGDRRGRDAARSGHEFSASYFHIGSLLD
jgi:hypothetical protein